MSAAVRSANTTNGTNATSVSVNQPATIATGDLLLVVGIVDVAGTTNVTTASSGWQRIVNETQGADVTRLVIFAKIATGTSGTDPITVTSANHDYVYWMAAIQDHNVANVTTDISLVTAAQADTGNANPPSLSPGSSADRLWIAIAGVDFNNSGNSITAGPTNYPLTSPGCNVKSAGSTTSVGLGVGLRTLTASSDDPPSFANSSRPWISKTIAVAAFTGVNTTPTVVTTTASVPAPTITAIRNVSVTATVVTAPASVPAPTVAAGLKSVRLDAAADRYSRAATGLGSTAFTMTAWVKFNTLRSDWQYFLGADNVSSYCNMGLTNSNELHWSTNGGSINTGLTPTADVWYFVAMVYDPSGTDHLYYRVAGGGSTTDVTGTTGGITDSWTFQIGPSGWAEWANCQIAAVKVWTAVLSAADIEAERPYYVHQRTSNIWAAYPLASPSTTDNSGNSRTLTAAGTITESTDGPPISWTVGGSSASVSATVVTATATVPAPTVSAGSSVTATVVTAAASVPAPTISTGTDQNATPTVVTTTASVPAPTVAVGSTATATVVTTTASVPAPNVTATALKSIRLDAAADRYSRAATGLGSTAVTMTCWVKFNTLSSDYQYFLGADNASSQWIIGLNNSNQLHLSTAGGSIDSAFTPTANTWYFVAAVYDPSGTDHLYYRVAGGGSTTDVTGTTGGITDSWTFQVGANGWGEWTDCQVAAVKVWTAALNSTEIETERPYYVHQRTSNIWAAYTLATPGTTDNSGNSRTLSAGGTITEAGDGPPLAWTADDDADATHTVFTATITVPAPTIITPDATVNTTVVTATVSVPTPFAGTPAAGFPVAISGNSRYVVDGAGQPWFMVGDAGWGSISNLSAVERETYFDELEAHGFNAVIVSLVEGWYSANPFENRNNDPAFDGAVYNSTPNADYWDFVDDYIASAEDHGITVIAFPAYIGFNHDGTADEIVAATDASMEDYGEFLGARYAAAPNIIWVAGGDRSSVSSTILGRVDALMTGIANTSSHLRTGHVAGDDTADEVWGAYSWFQVNNAYQTTEAVIDGPGGSLQAWNDSPTRPAFNIEGFYEQERTTPYMEWGDRTLRYQAWGSAATGLFGHVFGNNPRWHFEDGPDLYSAVGTWEESLTHSTRSLGTQHMALYSSFWQSIDWHLLAPDTTDTFLTSGEGTGTTKAGASFDATNGRAVVYTVGTSSITVDLTELDVVGTVVVRRFDPTAGSFTTVGSYSTAAPQSITHPGNNAFGHPDWVYLIEPSIPASVNATVVTATASVPAPTVTVGANAAVTPAVVTVVASVLAPTVTAGSSTTATVVTAAASVPAPTVSGSAAHTATVVTAPASVPAPSITAGANVNATPTVVTATASALAPTVSVGSTATPAVVTATASVPAPAVTGSAVATATVVTAAASVPAPTVSAGVVANPAVVTVPASVPNPAISAGSNVNVNAATVTATASVLAPAASAGSRAIPAAVTAAASVPAPTASGGANASPAAVTATVTLPSAVVAVGSSIVATTVTITGSVPGPGVTAGSNVNVGATVVTATASVLSPSASGRVAVTASTVTVTATVPLPAASAGVLAVAVVVGAVAEAIAPVISSGLAPEITGPLDTLKLTIDRTTETLEVDRTTTVIGDRGRDTFTL